MKKIVDLRNKQGISQKELADALNITQASVSRWEKNQQAIIGKNLIKLARYFNVSTDSLLGIEQEK